jgi:two-component system sensor histidine kinase ChvG
VASNAWSRRLPFGRSRLGRAIFALNLLSLLVLIVGAWGIDQLRQGQIRREEESLKAQAQLTGEVIADAATEGVPEPHLVATDAATILARFIPQSQRARLFDAQGNQISDSYAVAEGVDVHALPPARKPGDPAPPDKTAQKMKMRTTAQTALHNEVREALAGAPVVKRRLNEHGVEVVSVSYPLRRVKAVLGVLTLEGGDIDKIGGEWRWALVPFIVIALLVTALSGFLLNRLVSRPIQRLSAAADRVRLSQAREISLPDLESRKDEIGDLAKSLESMTATLWRRMEEIDRFAADVSHEIKNPLTSIRSALETLKLVKDEAAKERLMNVINQDVRRLDRLITDISNASRLDAELSRDQPKKVEVGALLDDIVSLYHQSRRDNEPEVTFTRRVAPADACVNGREGPLGQVFRNVIDNARSFSPEGGSVRVTLDHGDDPHLPLRVRIEDDGPGIPEENLETIFQRFYTSRPKGTSFGRNSGLGLSISRQIVEAHRGRIWAENRRSPSGAVEGARFCILLPAVH